MSKNKKIFIVILILLIVISAILILSKYINNIDRNKEDESKLNICKKISNKIDSNAKVVLVYENNDSTKEDVDLLVKELKDNYNALNIFRINHADNYSCLKKIANSEDLNELTSGEVSIMLFENHKNTAFSVNSYDYYNVEEFLILNKFIEKQVIEETVTLNEIRNKINQEKYILLMVQNEKNYNSAKKIMSEEYPEFSYDIINYRSDEGSKMYDYIAKNYKIIDEIPQFIYFNKGKIVSNDILNEVILSTVLK